MKFAVLIITVPEPTVAEMGFLDDCRANMMGGLYKSRQGQENFGALLEILFRNGGNETSSKWFAETGRKN